MMRKWLLALSYVSGLGAAFMYRYTILDWLGQDGHVPLSILAAAALALFPVVPYKAVIGLFGYVYGSLAGGAMCWLATTAAAALMFGGVKWLWPEKGRAYLSSVPALHKFTSAVRRRPFASVVAARLLPVIPQTAVNVYAAAAGLPFWSFILASGLGKIPGIALFAFLGGNAREHPAAAVIASVLYIAALLLLGVLLKGGKYGSKGSA
ncbi:putative membrane protein YdjX (TVP38/TMEM64 family) [Paenibacillus forsythiae]|uniref:TVP38/TMEM64 family membrane protein n=1 Tax=Paenibacillus forsythiae TaxID=365616 RepID=A0ABU3H9D6_9BACL|nr:VTT domain-containing protein [Paenibacillus forsythiae]MDT3427428.1 putative membrane protein YdjX (TVP38/TMEM64 family) [Paenibacillus forsythiae]